MKKIFFIIIITFSLFSTSNVSATDLTASDVTTSALCPRNGCGSWNNINKNSWGTAISSSILGSDNQMFMYSTRNYFAPTSLGHLTVEIYDYWDEISFSSEMISTYRDLYNSGLRTKMTELMYQQNTLPNIALIDDNMYNALIKIIKYHESKTLNSKFKAFLSDAKKHIDELKGKSLYDLRMFLYGCSGAVGTC